MSSISLKYSIISQPAGLDNCTKHIYSKFHYYFLFVIQTLFISQQHRRWYLLHQGVWVTIPQADRVGQEVLLQREQNKSNQSFYGLLDIQTCTQALLTRSSYRNKNAGSPKAGEEVEGTQLTRLIELAVLGFREVHLPVDFLNRRGFQ